MFDKDKAKKSYYQMCITLDLGQRTIQAVLKREDGKIIKEIKTRKQADTILQFLKDISSLLSFIKKFTLLKTAGL